MQILTSDEDTYVNSLSRCVKWAAKGGKSGSLFHKTLDERFIMKQMSRFELQSFLDLAPKYFQYVSDAVKNQVSN